MISIIIPVYIKQNKKSFLRKTRQDVFKICLQSVLRQSYDDVEVIVVDDGSSVDLSPVVAEFQKKFKNFMYEKIEHSGANRARNRGFKLSQGDMVLFLDADIKMRADMIERLKSTLDKNPEASYAYSRFLYGFKKFRVGDFDEEKLKQMPYIHTSSLIRREDFPGFDESVKRLQDWDLYLTMLERECRGIFVPEYLFKIYTQGSMSEWLPSLFYRKPFNTLLPNIIRNKQDKYFQAMEIVKNKHRL